MTRTLLKSGYYRGASALLALAFLQVLVWSFPRLLVNNWCLVHDHLGATVSTPIALAFEDDHESREATKSALPAVTVEEEGCVKLAASSVMSSDVQLPNPAFVLLSVVPMLSGISFDAVPGTEVQIQDSDQPVTHIPAFISQRTVVITV